MMANDISIMTMRERLAEIAEIIEPMNTIRLLLATLILSLLPSCAVAPPPLDTPGANDSDVGIHLVGQADKIGVVVQFTMHGDYTHVVQEIALDSGAALVECFRWDGSIHDRHHWGSVPHWRTMKVYAADVEGADEAHGFAHLPQNMDGSVKTTVGPLFNQWYQDDYETRGRITRQSPTYFTWSIHDDGKTITVNLPETK